MTHVLRKSYGPWSAGTRVDLMGDYFYIGDEGIPSDLVVELRNRTDMVPQRNRRVRRSESGRVNAIVESLKGK